MLPTWNTRILTALENMESEIQLRLASEVGASVLRESYSPFLEADRAEEVDRVCADVALELARREGSISLMPMTVLMSIQITDLVMWRIRDAQRQVKGMLSNVWNADPDAFRIFHSLLVDSWHSYAEPYWLERLERLEAPLQTPTETKLFMFT